MSVHALHKAIQYRLEEVVPGEWHWSFAPPKGLARSGRVRGQYQFAQTVVRRAIDIWHLMNRDEQSKVA
jgi:hypothetical protein